jgi:hypothetical protein
MARRDTNGHAGPKPDDRPIATLLAELRALDVPSLVEHYEAAFGHPPRVKHREHLWRKIAWRIQEQRLGGLSGAARRRLDELIADLDVPALRPRTTRAKAPKTNGEPPLGTTLVRVWHGREILATRSEEGWECNGVVHRSLSALARAVTGTRWNGRLFFGLVKRKGGRG